MVPDFAALLSCMVRVARPLTLSTLPSPVILSTWPFRSRVRDLAISSVEVIVMLSVNLTDLPSAMLFCKSAALLTATGSGGNVAPAVDTRGFVTSPDVTKAAHMGSAHTNTRVIRMGSSRLFMAVPPSMAHIFLSRACVPQNFLLGKFFGAQALLYDHLTRKCRERQREYPDVGITNRCGRYKGKLWALAGDEKRPAGPVFCVQAWYWGSLPW